VAGDQAHGSTLGVRSAQISRRVHSSRVIWFTTADKNGSLWGISADTRESGLTRPAMYAWHLLQRYRQIDVAKYLAFNAWAGVVLARPSPLRMPGKGAR